MNFSRVYALNFAKLGKNNNNNKPNNPPAPASNIKPPPPTLQGANPDHLAWIKYATDIKGEQYDEAYKNWSGKNIAAQLGSRLLQLVGFGDHARINRLEQDRRDMLAILADAEKIKKSGGLSDDKMEEKLKKLHHKIAEIDELGRESKAVPGETRTNRKWLWNLVVPHTDVFMSDDSTNRNSITGINLRRVPRRSGFRQWIRGLWSRPQTHSIYQNTVNFNNKGRYSHVLYY